MVVLAGGVREELQRAFIIHRFRQRLGGGLVGLAVYSLLFGLLHFDQGWDVAIAVGSLGLLWGILYIRRGSAVMSMTNHASFNAAQVIIARDLGHVSNGQLRTSNFELRSLVVLCTAVLALIAGGHDADLRVG